MIGLGIVVVVGGEVGVSGGVEGKSELKIIDPGGGFGRVGGFTGVVTSGLKIGAPEVLGESVSNESTDAKINSPD